MKYLILFFLLTTVCFAQPKIKQGISLYYECDDKTTKSIHLIDGKVTGFYTAVSIFYCDNSMFDLDLLGDDNDDLNFRDKVIDYKWTTGTFKIDAYSCVELYGEDDVLLARISKKAEDDFFEIQNFPVSVKEKDNKSKLIIQNFQNVLKINNPDNKEIDDIKIYNLLGQNLFSKSNINSSEYNIKTDLFSDKMIFIIIRTKDETILEKLLLD